jgi:uncharacterized membrane protein YdjX (TVP38/TMEM64 family)/rhodanese-related sulfurtransferase
MGPRSDDQPQPPAKVMRGVRLALAVLLVAAVVAALVYRDRIDAGAVQAWVRSAGAWAPVLFVLLYALATVLFLPGSLLTLAGGALFGPVLGTVYNLTGATLGASLAFLAARYLASDWVAHRSAGRLAQLIRGVEAEGWRFVAFVRLVPLFPFNLLNYALGLTRIGFVQYAVASYVFMLPGALAYTYLGYAGREAVAGGEGLIQKGLLALGLLAVVAFMPRLIRTLRAGPGMDVAQLKQQLDAGDDLLVLDVRSDAGDVGIPGATRIPIDRLSQRVGDIDAANRCTVAIVGDDSRQAAKAQQLLNAAGFSDVRPVTGGMREWTRHGFPVR